MRLTVFAAGSRGDIQPCLALSQALQQAGYAVRLAALENFADFAGQHAVEFWPLRGDVQRLMASETGRQYMQAGGANPLRSIQAVRTLLAPVVQQMTADAFAACRDADALLCLGVLSAFGQSIAEVLRIPVIHLEPTPLLPTRAFPAPGWPIQRSLGGWHNFFSGVAMLQVIWLWYRPFVNDFRRQQGLSPYSFARFHQALRSAPLLGAYSPSLIPRPADWPPTVHITGAFFLDDQAGWQPPPELLAFLEAGAPPVYIGFGSMAGDQPEQLSRLVLEALEQSGQRGLLLTGWGGLRAQVNSDRVFVIGSVPHPWLFPRMAAVVHHGGAGTTAEGLRAGAPSVILPFVMDQFFWGERVKALGLGPAPIPRQRLTAGRLAGAIGAAVTDPGIRQRAGRCGEAMRAEAGLSRAVALIRRYTGETGGSAREPSA